MIKSKYNIFIVFLISTMLFSLFNITVKAESNRTYDDTNNYYFQTNSVSEQNLYGVNYQKINGQTASGNQVVDMFSMKADGVSSKLVVWSPQYSNYRNNRMTLTKMAADYEANHPGWKVIAGTNADQWTMGFGTQLSEKGTDYYEWQTLYPALMDGERRFAYAAVGPANNLVGFTNDGSTNGMVQINANDIDGLYVEILDNNNNILSKHLVNGINEKATDNNTSVWFSYVNDNKDYQSFDISGEHLYFVSNAELAYMNNSRTYTFKDIWAIDSVFGRGTIDEVTTSVTSLKEGQFVIDTNDEELINLLAQGVRVRVQLSYLNDAYNNFEAGSGFHAIQRLNGQDYPVEGGYNTSGYARSVFGIKDDGTYILMTSDYARNGGTPTGLKGWEINALLKEHTVVTAYQCDGGGSATAILRNEAGGFDVVNSPCDGSERAVLTGMFFVVKDCGVKLENVDATSNSLTLNIDTTDVNFDKIKKIYCTLNGETKEIINNQVSFTGLEKMTDYIYSFSYDTETEYGIDGLVNGKVKTAKTVPIISDLIVEIKNNYIYFNPIFIDEDYAIDYIRIVYGNNRIPYLDEPIVIAIPEGIDKFEYTFTYCYNLQDGKDKVIYEETRTLVLKATCTHEWDNACDTECNLCKETREITHDYTNATCNMLATCKICGHTTGEKLSHTPIIDEKVEATCTQAGKTEGSHCSVCNTVIKEQETVEKLEHTWVDATKKEPKTCSVCGETEGEPLKGCKKKSVASILISISMLAGVLLIFRKKK